MGFVAEVPGATNVLEGPVHEASSGVVDEEEPIFPPSSVHSFHEPNSVHSFHDPGSVHSFHEPGSVENLHDMGSIVVQEEVVETSEAHATQGDDDADTDFSPEETTNQVCLICLNGLNSYKTVKF